MNDSKKSPEPPLPLERREVDLDGVAREPEGLDELRQKSSTVSAATTGAIPGESMDEARVRLRDAQGALIELGYEVSAEEREHGVWGPTTRLAVTRFQEDRDIPVTGQLDLATYEALLAEDEDSVRAGSPEE